MPCIIRSRLPLISHVTPYNAASSVCDPIKDDRRRGAWIKYCLPVRQCPQLSYAPPTTVPPAPSPLGSNCCQRYHPLHARSEEVGWPRAPLDLRWSPGGRHTETTVPTTGSIVFFSERLHCHLSSPAYILKCWPHWLPYVLFCFGCHTISHYLPFTSLQIWCFCLCFTSDLILS
jgi:hypothetical protein